MAKGWRALRYPIKKGKGDLIMTDLKEQLTKFIETQRAINEEHRRDSLDDDHFMASFVNGKEAVLERLEELINA